MQHPHTKWLQVIPRFPTMVFCLFLVAVLFVRVGEVRGDIYLDSVFSFERPDGSSDDGGPPTNAIGAPDRSYVSVDIPEILTLAFVDNRVVNGPGADLEVFEVFGGDSFAEFWGSDDGANFEHLITTNRSFTFDIGNTSLNTLSHLRVVGLDDGGGSQGYDLDAAAALNSIAVPEPNVALLLVLCGLFALLLRKGRRCQSVCRPLFLSSFVVFSLACFCLQTDGVSADIVEFDDVTDTISVNAFPNMSSSTTIEAVVKFDTSSSGGGMIYNQWRNFQEDKAFAFDATSNQLVGYLNIGSPVFAGGPVGLDKWRHLAYVYDGSEERLYVDGQLVASQSSSGDIPDGTSGRQTVIGAIDRSVAPPDFFRNSFIGEMESLRISSVTRYSGASFTPHSGDFLLDSDALLIFNFDETPGSNSVTDLVSGAVGTFGVGFGGATSPFIMSGVPEPSSGFLLSIVGTGLFLKRSRRLIND